MRCRIFSALTKASKVVSASHHWPELHAHHQRAPSHAWFPWLDQPLSTRCTQNEAECYKTGRHSKRAKRWPSSSTLTITNMHQVGETLTRRCNCHHVPRASLLWWIRLLQAGRSFHSHFPQVGRRKRCLPKLRWMWMYESNVFDYWKEIIYFKCINL